MTAGDARVVAVQVARRVRRAAGVPAMAVTGLGGRAAHRVHPLASDHTIPIAVVAAAIDEVEKHKLFANHESIGGAIGNAGKRVFADTARSDDPALPLVSPPAKSGAAVIG